MRFYFLTGDVNWQEYGGLFYSRVFEDGRVFELIRWDGVQSVEGFGRDRYTADKIAIDLDRCDESGDSDAALASCGFRRDEEGIWNGGDKIAPPAGPAHDRILLECLAYYGGFDLIASYSDTNWSRLYRDIRHANGNNW